MGQTEQDKKKDELVQAFADGATFQEAARRVGVGRGTVYRWMSADPEFTDRVTEARDLSDDAVEYVTYRNCLDPDPAHNTLRMFWLKCRRPHVYRDTQPPPEGGISVTVRHVREGIHGRPAGDAQRAGIDFGGPEAV
jgi:hypothetical protein